MIWFKIDYNKKILNLWIQLKMIYKLSCDLKIVYVIIYQLKEFLSGLN